MAHGEAGQTKHALKHHRHPSVPCAGINTTTERVLPNNTTTNATTKSTHASCRGTSHQGHHTSVMARVKVRGLEFTRFGAAPYCCTALSSTRARASCASSPATTATLHRHCMSQARVRTALWCTMVVPALPPHRRPINTLFVLAAIKYPPKLPTLHPHSAILTIIVPSIVCIAYADSMVAA